MKVGNKITLRLTGVIIHKQICEAFCKIRNIYHHLYVSLFKLQFVTF